MPKIKIDATALDYTNFTIPGLPLYDANVVQEIDVSANLHRFQIGSGLICDFIFGVSPDGIISYDQQYEKFLDGAGTNVLRLVGFRVDIDARYLSTPGVILGSSVTVNDFFQQRQFRLLPAVGHGFQQGSGINCDVGFFLDFDGHFKYDPVMDIASGGPLKGAGTSRLQLLGYPILVDARGLGSAAISLIPVQEAPTTRKVMLLNILPAKYFFISENGSAEGAAGFDLDGDGKITLRNGAAATLKLDTFRGIPRITARKSPPKVAASAPVGGN